MVSTGGERDLGWNGPPKDGKPPSATRRLGFTDLLDILPSLSLSLIRPPKLYLSPSITWSREHSIAQISQNKMGILQQCRGKVCVGRRSESLLARGGGGGGGTSGNGVRAAAGGSEEEEPGARVAGWGWI